MSDVLPDNLVAYRRTPIFNQDSLPAALRRRHTTKDDVWGLIVVLEGRLLYRLLEPRSERILDPQTPGVIKPRQVHEVEPVGPVSFFVEFYGDTKTVQPAASAMTQVDSSDGGMGFAGRAARAPCRWWCGAAPLSRSAAGGGGKPSSPVSGISRFRRMGPS